ncbi:MAG: MFS transporter, partial [Patescibacteria group bacterium]
MLKNRNLLIIALIAVVNALGYGIIIPILYSYSVKFGLSDFQNGLLFSLFSICQFLATPIIGRLSDKYGRRPLLMISIAGTAVSFFMTAFAPNAIILFLARALDGITAGNIPVASAVISDTTKPKDRAKGFGVIGASFGFGFIFGPAISALTVGIDAAVPFIIAGIISTIAVILTYLFLPETNKHIGEVKKGKLFDFSKLVHAAIDPNVGTTLLIMLVYSFSFGMLLYAFQPFSVKALGLSANEISGLFTLFGVVGLVTQIVFLPKITKILGDKKTFVFSLI